MFFLNCRGGQNVTLKTTASTTGVKRFNVGKCFARTLTHLQLCGIRLKSTNHISFYIVLTTEEPDHNQKTEINTVYGAILGRVASNNRNSCPTTLSCFDSLPASWVCLFPGSAWPSSRAGAPGLRGQKGKTVSRSRRWKSD